MEKHGCFTGFTPHLLMIFSIFPSKNNTGIAMAPAKLVNTEPEMRISTGIDFNPDPNLAIQLNPDPDPS
jgi:hypothetical protein